MRSLIALQDRLLASLGNGDNALPFAARFAFAASLKHASPRMMLAKPS